MRRSRVSWRPGTARSDQACSVSSPRRHPTHRRGGWTPSLDRSARAREALTVLHAAEHAESLDVPIAVLAESYVHMHLNRLFRAEQRAHELVVYDFLSCLYESRLARCNISSG